MFTDLIYRLRALLRRSTVEREMEEELRFHLDHQREKLLKSGVSPEEAARRTRLSFGGPDQIKEECRQSRGVSLLETTFQDLRYAARVLLKAPGFTTVAVLSLALGIGATTAIFSIFDAIMLKSLPVRDPQRLVAFGRSDFEPNVNVKFPYPMFLDFRDHSSGFLGMSATSQIEHSNLIVNGPGGGSDSALARIGLVSGNYFSVLGVEPVLGRALTPDDDRVLGGHPVAVISHGYWQRRFSTAPDVLGRTISMNGTAYTILGVAPPCFTGHTVGHPADLWIPISMTQVAMGEYPSSFPLSNDLVGIVSIVARLTEGVPPVQAQASVDLLYQGYKKFRDSPPGAVAPQEEARIRSMHVTLLPAARGSSPERTLFRQPILILIGTVTLLLAIVCANLANLLLARGAARQKEIATRLAIGAGRARVVRQLLTESLLLAAVGGIAGIFFAIWMTRGLIAMIASSPQGLLYHVSLDLRMLSFAAGLCIVTGVVFGLAPALHAPRMKIFETLKGLHARSRIGVGRILVIGQVALSILLLAGAGLFVRTLRNLKSLDLGFERERLLMVQLGPDQNGYRGARLSRLFRAVEERIGMLPGVRAAAVSSNGLIAPRNNAPRVYVQGYTPHPDTEVEDLSGQWNLVGTNYFHALGMQLPAGRSFTARDVPGAPRVAVVNEAFARHYFGGASPIGKRLGLRREVRGDAIEIVGCVRDAKYNSLRDRTVRMIYLPFAQDEEHLWDMWLNIRTIADPAAVAAMARAELRDIDRNLPIVSIQTVEQQMDKSLVQERMIAILAGFFGIVALVLAAIGLYGVLSYSVARRTGEIGIRISLGSTRGGVLALVLRETMWMVVAGIAVGLAVTLAVTRLVATQLYGVSSGDPLTLSAAAALMLAVAALAGVIPARRATGVDPMTALRYE